MTELAIAPNIDDRTRRERYFRVPIENILNTMKLPEQFEASQVEMISSAAIDSDNPNQRRIERIKRDFPSGTFLFHGATTANIVKILQSGFLMNAAAINTSERSDQGGSEGISWSLSDIEALPGTRYHLAGFVAAPEMILADGSQLAMPDRAAPYEMMQIPQKIDAEKFYGMYSDARALEREYLAKKERGEQGVEALRARILAQKALLDSMASGSNVYAPVDNTIPGGSKAGP